MVVKVLTQLADMLNPKADKLDVEIEIDDQIWIKPKGYGDFCSEDGYGVPICIERAEGRLRVILWPDINEEDPMVIGMEGALETMRKEEKREGG
jgi:hypothetical protein